jgi:hypothetical protein
MKKAILAFVLVAVSSGAWAQWVRVSESESAVFYVDPTAIKKNETLRRYGALRDFSDPDKDGDLSARVVGEFDCEEERFRYLQQHYFRGPMGRGE